MESKYASAAELVLKNRIFGLRLTTRARGSVVQIHTG